MEREEPVEARWLKALSGEVCFFINSGQRLEHMTCKDSSSANPQVM